MNVIRVSIIFLWLYSFRSSFAQGYTLVGTVNGAGDGWAYVRHRETKKADSGRMTHGEFTISGMVNTPEFCSFGLTLNSVKDYYLSFFLEKGRSNMRADKESLNDISITFNGGKVEKEFQQFQKQTDSLNQLHYDQRQADAALARLADVFALKHPKSYVSAFALISYENDLPRLSKLYADLAIEIQHSYYGRLIKERLGKQ